MLEEDGGCPLKGEVPELSRAHQIEVWNEMQYRGQLIAALRKEVERLNRRLDHAAKEARK
jgi:hypothetical protein